MLGKVLMGLGALGVVAGIVTMFKVFTEGFTLYAKTDVLVWTLPLATYIFFSLSSAGLAFISSLPTVFGLRRYEAIEKRVLFLELSFLAAAFVCLIMHLGSPLNVIYLVLAPNPASPLWWLAMLYGLYLVVLLASFKQAYADQPSKGLGVMILLIAVFASSCLGWLLGMTDARPALDASFLTIFFPLTALVSGLAAITVFGLGLASSGQESMPKEHLALYDEMAKILGVLVGFTLVLFIWRTVIGGASSPADGFSGFRYMMGSVSYHIELWVGLVLPLLLLLIRGVRMSTGGKVMAGLAVLVGMLFGRLELILTAVVVPMGAMAEAAPQYASYVPTLWEILVTAFGVSTMLLIYSAGNQFLKLEPRHD